ncbi:type VI secretion system-associated FHA domain protein TagH [Methylobacterium sp. 37f]|uniref:type VI secretion system-associated FHA domain protein TagH n=1 Tax=Methylobacterium sp. 37f TaxID=2817058 RepID=UPI001FFDA09C|nr:type VI secretion system-associated FHA domain protein TagH [Methylobacterium sp. 37f]MCK2056126.1 type VI secretion system-associated FHA domain protein TagH [Methylobacterium sp. 37f]
MPLHLTIENKTSLPHGGPLSYTLSGTHRLDIGRDPYLEWSLPDPTVSSRHCEIRFRDGAYWLNDVSRNGTFVNQTTQRVQEPCLLRTGDRLYIGQYIIDVRIDGEAGMRQEPDVARPPFGAAGADTWADSLGAPGPIDPGLLKPSGRPGPVGPDFSAQLIDMPEGPGRDQRPPQTGDAIPGLGSQGEARPHRHDAPATAPFQPWPDPGRSVGSPFPEPPFRGSPQAPPSQPAPSPNPWGEPSLGTVQIADPPRPVGAGARVPAAQAASTVPVGVDEFVRRFAKGAGIPAETVAWRDPADLAEDLGVLTRLVADSLKQLLAARTETKRIVRVSSHTTIQSVGNNPLKFSPTVDDALQIMFGRPNRSYLAAHDALEDGFRDAKAHQKKVFEAMRDALRLLFKELDPEEIVEALSEDRGLGSLLGSRKARLWDLYASRWAAMTAAHEDGMIDAFMVYFSDSYDGRK